MEDIEYGKMSKLYDVFYSGKDYKKEALFISKFLKDGASILDAGCGTGSHCKELKALGYTTDGFDLSPDMISIAKEKVSGNFTVASLLDFSSKINYDAIISFFAVFNHLWNYKEFEFALSNLKDHLEPKGIIILDLHNPQQNGSKLDIKDNTHRNMKWRICPLLGKEITKITYTIDGEIFETSHTFKIFKMPRIKKIAEKLGFVNVEFYSNYDTTCIATKKSKNIQVVLYT